MKKFTKKAISLLIVALMVCALLPTAAFAGYVSAEQWGYTPDLTINMEGSENNINRYTVVYHANYDYTNEGDDVTYVVEYLADEHMFDEFTYKLLTAGECGFTADGYVQDADDPWSLPDEYPVDFDGNKNAASFQEFDFKDGNHLGGVKGDSTTGVFWTSDGSAVIDLYANWETKGDPVEVPDPVEPKPEHPTVDKKVNDGDSTSAAAGETVNFTLTSTVPADLADCIDFTGEGTVQHYVARNRGEVKEDASYTLTFHDEMDQHLAYNDDIQVQIGKNSLDKSSYTVTATDLGDNCTFHVTLDLCSLYTDGVITDNDFKGKTSIVVSYSATLSKNATAGTYTNKSHVTWIKNNESGGGEDDEVDVYTYKIQLTKLDKDDKSKKLAGATFKLEIENENGKWEPVGEELTTDEDGMIAWDGLKEGSYQLTETEAPDGYVMDTRPVSVTLPDDASETNQIANVTFTNGGTPHTGGSGTVAYTAGGLTLLVCAAGVFVVSRKKSRG